MSTRPATALVGFTLLHLTHEIESMMPSSLQVGAVRDHVARAPRVPRLRSATSVALFLATVPTALCSQAPRHRVAANDTLRWREVRTTAVVSEMFRSFETRVEIRQEGAIRVVRGADDTISVSYDSVSATTGMSGSSMRITLPFERDAPVKVILTDSGCVRVFDNSADSAPSDLSSALAAARRVSPPFDDIFIPLPSVPLAVGVSWPERTQMNDSTVQTSALAVGQPNRSYRVVRDTVVGGAHALIIEMQFSSTSHASGRSLTAPTVNSSRTSSQESGTIVFDPAAGIVIGRRTTGEHRTAMTVKADGGGSLDTKSVSTYEHTIELVRP